MVLYAFAAQSVNRTRARVRFNCGWKKCASLRRDVTVAKQSPTLLAASTWTLGMASAYGLAMAFMHAPSFWNPPGARPDFALNMTGIIAPWKRII